MPLPPTVTSRPPREWASQPSRAAARASRSRLGGILRVQARAAIFSAARRVTPYLATELDGIRLLFATDESGPGRGLFVHGWTPDLDVLPRALAVLDEHGERPDGRLLVDVGANIGTTTILGLLRGGFARAVAVEPLPSNLELLHANLAVNGLVARVDVVGAAATAEDGVAQFKLGRTTRHGRSTGTGGLLGAKHGSAGEISVPTVTVDRVLEDRGLAPEDVGLLWIDVQGHEGHVASGARSVLAKSRPIVFACRPGKLRRSGGRETLVQLVADHYAHVVDLRAPAATIAPSGDLETLMQPHSTTDFLAFGRGG